MNNNDKLRFAIKASFDKVSKEKLDEMETLFEDLYEQMCEEYGYSGDSPYYDAINEFVYNARGSFSDDEDFIQVIGEHSDYGTFGWALNEIKDSQIYEYAKDYLRDILSKDDSLYEEEIADYLSRTDLPS